MNAFAYSQKQYDGHLNENTGAFVKAAVFSFHIACDKKVQHSWRALLSKKTNHEESARSCESYENKGHFVPGNKSHERTDNQHHEDAPRRLCLPFVLVDFNDFACFSLQGYWAAVLWGGKVWSLVWKYGRENRRVVSEFGTRSSPFRWHALRSRLTSATAVQHLNPKTRAIVQIHTLQIW